MSEMPRLGLPGEDYDDDAATITHSDSEVEQQVKEPPRYQVLLHNDDYTPMDFVVLVLEEVFFYSHPRAFDLMKKVHVSGSGVIGVYSYEIAEMKIVKATEMAHSAGFPLLLTLEPESD